MIPNQERINSHIENYLDYYCNLSHEPHFAVLLKGEWGCGKTWFINRYCEKLKANNQKCLYVSLYGMTSFPEIEDAFFQQLQPFLSSKPVVLVRNIFTQVIKGTLKIDLNHDGKEDGTLTIGTPDLNLTQYFTNLDKILLIFDDLERCQIDISNLLGYINYFVEHQGLKVIVVANEDELFKQDSSNLSNSYKNIKEKLIGKTFAVYLDFEGALENFITRVNNPDVGRFLSENTELIEDLYQKAKYENLRNLKQIVLDFERIFEVLPDRAKSKPELLQDILKILIALSIEIKRGAIPSKDISKLNGVYTSESLSIEMLRKRQEHNSDAQNNSIEETSPDEILKKYPELDLYTLFPSKEWWKKFFDKGILDKQELQESLLSSKYFQDENTPIWRKLWHFSYLNLNDDDFEDLLEQLESEFNDIKYVEIGIIKHITGLFLRFSEAGLYNKSKDEILKESKLYIDYFKNNNKLDIPANRYVSADDHIPEAYAGLGYQASDFIEFKEFCSYINKVEELIRVENMPSVAQNLLVIMQNDVWKFYKMIHISNSPEQIYYDVPILKYIEPDAFVEKLLLMKPEDRKPVGWAMTKRYEFVDINKQLFEELDWLKFVRDILLNKANQKKGKLSGYQLELFTQRYLNEAIQKLEKKDE